MYHSYGIHKCAEEEEKQVHGHLGASEALQKEGFRLELEWLTLVGRCVCRFHLATPLDCSQYPLPLSDESVEEEFK